MGDASRNPPCVVCLRGWDAGAQAHVCGNCTSLAHLSCAYDFMNRPHNSQTPYFCPDCLAGTKPPTGRNNTTLRMAQYEDRLMQGIPAHLPQPAFTLFSLAVTPLYQDDIHQSGMDMGVVLAHAWAQIEPEEKRAYEAKAVNEVREFRSQMAKYQELFAEYKTFCASVGQLPRQDLMPEVVTSVLQGGAAPVVVAPAGVGASTQQAGVKRPAPGGWGGSVGSARGRGQRASRYGGDDEGDDEEDEEEEEEALQEEESDDSDFGSKKKGKGRGRGRGAGRGRVGRADMDVDGPPYKRARDAMNNGLGEEMDVGGGGGRGGRKPGYAAALQAHVSHAAKDVTTGLSPLAAAVAMIGAPTLPAPAAAPAAGGSGETGQANPSQAVVASRPPQSSSYMGFTAAQSVNDLPAEFTVSCQSNTGRFYLLYGKVVCECYKCQKQPPESREFHPTHWEQHCGAGAAKKWKASIKVEPGGGAPELPRGLGPMPIGKYFDLRGVDVRPARTIGQMPTIEFIGVPLVRDRTARHAAPEIPTEILDAGPREVGAARRAALAQKQEAHRVTGHNDEGDRSSPAPPPRPAVHQPVIIPTWPPHEDVKYGNYRPIKVRWAGDHCCVCGSDVDYDCDQLMTCDACGITVHQSCYGVMELPGVNDIWLCRACELKEEDQPEPQCCLCPVTGGALKPTTIPGMWCHAACMQWIPEVTCLDPMRMEPIDRILNIQRERWELTCCVCKQKMGAKVQCSTCYTAYHPLCGRMAGLTMEMTESPLPGGGLQVLCLCPKHCKPKPHASGMTRVMENESGTANGQGLYNCQPFPPMPALPIPRCTAGCARAQALDDTQRVSHGTGAGCTTLKAFWIPEEAPPGTEAARLQQAARARAKAKSRQAMGLLGGGEVRRGRPKSYKPREGSVGGDIEEGPPPQVDLIQLPAGVPDTLDVICAGRRAVMYIRSQRIVYDEQEMSCSRFEQICGKGDAKKWKTSLWTVDPVTGDPDITMQEWLNTHEMDRETLGTLASNYSQHEAYKEWFAAQNGEDGVLDDEDLGVDADGNLIGGGGASEDPAGGDTTAAGTAAVEGNSNGGDAPAAGTGTAGTTEGGRGTPEKAKSEVKSESIAAVHGTLSGGAGEGVAAAPMVVDEGAAAAGKGEGGGDTGKGEDGTAAAAPAPDAGAEANPEGAADAPPPAPPPEPVTMRLQRPDSYEVDEIHWMHGNAVRAEVGLPPLPPPPAPTIPAVVSITVVGAGPPPPPTTSTAPILPPLIPGHTNTTLPGVPPVPVPANSFTPITVPGATPDAMPNAIPGVPTEPTGPPPPPPPPPPVCLPAGSAVSLPEACVGHCCRMYWPDDNEWYDADVVAYDPVTKQHSLWYHADEVTEVIDLATEDSESRVQWLPVVDCSLWPPPPIIRRPPPTRFESQSHLSIPPTPSNAGAAAAISTAGPQPSLTLSRATSQGSAQLPPSTPAHPPPSRGPSMLSQAHSQPQPGSGPSTQAHHGPPTKVPSQLSQQLPPQPPPPKATSPSPPEPPQKQEPKPPPPPPPPPRPTPPPVIDVICNGLRGEFLVNSMEVRTLEGHTITGTEFERAAGRGAAKKWKVSIRVCKPDGSSGVTIQDWLVEHGLEAPRSHKSAIARDASTVTATTATEGVETGRKRTSAYRRDSSMTEGPGGEGRGGDGKGKVARVHRPDCMCIICKQGRGASGGAAALAAGGNVHVRGNTGGTSTSKTQAVQRAQVKWHGPQLRSGKRAFVHAMPHIVCGLRQHKLWAIPTGRVWSPDEWETLRTERSKPEYREEFLQGDEDEEEGGEGDKGKTIKAEGSVQDEKGRGAQQGEMVDPEGEGVTQRGQRRSTPTPVPDSVVDVVVSTSAVGGVGEGGSTAKVDTSAPGGIAGTGTSRGATPEPGAITSRSVGMGPQPGAVGLGGAGTQPAAQNRLVKAMPAHQRLRQARMVESFRLTFGKSGVHGWGIFALRDIAADSLISEYRGVCVRPSVAELLEKKYREEGRDCYFFKANEDVMVDSTNGGCLSRFTNHCCMPSLYTKVLMDDKGEPHIAFFSKTALRAGQELTFDYRFRVEEETSRVRCQCGAPNCKGFLN